MHATDTDRALTGRATTQCRVYRDPCPRWAEHARGSVARKGLSALAHDGNGIYPGICEWDGADRAERYARSLWRVLELVSQDGSIDGIRAPGRRLLRPPARALLRPRHGTYARGRQGGARSDWSFVFDEMTLVPCGGWPGESL